MTRAQQIFSEIELFLDAGKYEDAKVLASFIDHEPLDRESRLYLLLINIKLDEPALYREEIERLPHVRAPTKLEKQIIRKIFLLESNWSENQSRIISSRPGLPNPPHAQLGPLGTLDRAPGEKDEVFLEERDAELQALKTQLAELQASTDHAVRSLEGSTRQNAALLEAKEAALGALDIRFNETVISLENQLSEKMALLGRRDAELREARFVVDQLSAQLAELERVKDENTRLLREQLGQTSELLQIKDTTIKNLEEQFSARTRALESQLSEKQNLLATREADIDSLMATADQLIKERTELAAQREWSDRLLQDDLRQKAELLQASEASIAELEEQTRAKIQWFERQLAQERAVVENSGAELADLRRQIQVFSENLAEVEAARLHTESLPHEQRSGVKRDLSAPDTALNEPVAGPHTHQAAAPETTSAAIPDNDGKSRCAGWLRRAWQMMRNPAIWPDNALPAAFAVVLIIPIVYYFSGDGRRPLGFTRSSSSPSTEARHFGEGTAPVAPAQGLADRKTSKTIPVARKTDKLNISPEQAIAYRTRRVVPLRAEPRFSAGAKSRIRAGTSISVIEARGDWFKVKIQPSGDVGYLRKEYLVRQVSAR